MLYNKRKKEVDVMIKFKNYEDKDYLDVCNFLIKLNQENKDYRHWNWARFEWMYEHPYFNKDDMHKIGLWYDDNEIIGVAIYDMYMGEAFVGTLNKYQYLYQDILKYAWDILKDDKGLGIAISDDNDYLIEKALDFGFFKAEAKETITSISLEKEFNYVLPKEIKIEEVNFGDAYELSFAIFQGFNHGNDEEEFKKDYQEPIWRKHQNPYLQLKALNENNKIVGYCGFWYDEKTDYAYIEPLCVIPEYRKLGIGKALIYEGLNRSRKLGAKVAFVLSDKDFYFKIGMQKEKTFNFYWKKIEMFANDKKYQIDKLLGKGKGGYSYLAKDGDSFVVLKQIHHEPCDYYQFGNKIEAEKNDYEKLINVGIRMPKMINIDLEKEIIIKEYIDGKTIDEMIRNNEDINIYIEQLKEMALKAKSCGLNIDYYPTNFVVNNQKLYYIDYECNQYDPKWNLENWGLKYWIK